MARITIGNRCKVKLFDQNHPVNQESPLYNRVHGTDIYGLEALFRKSEGFVLQVNVTGRSLLFLFPLRCILTSLNINI